MHKVFQAADILLPAKQSMQKWACVACDQFSEQPEYWDRVANFVGDCPSTFHMILPEAYLRNPDLSDPAARHKAMRNYLNDEIFRTIRKSFIYVERTLTTGKVRRGLIGQIDLEAYDFSPESETPIRATEQTARERLPARMDLVRSAPLEFPHVLVLCNDLENRILSAASEVRGEKIYDFDLMEGGGHICGWLISGLGVAMMNAAISDYIESEGNRQGTDTPMAFIVGDGNHSVAAAKGCWEERKRTLSAEEQNSDPGRYLLVELNNIHDNAIEFSAIHRLILGCDADTVRKTLRSCEGEGPECVTLMTSDGDEVFRLDGKRNPLGLGLLQPALDDMMNQHGGEIDYVHDLDALKTLSRKPGNCGLLLESMKKETLFPAILRNGVLPRKTFSMGHARDKRYYLEGKLR